MIFVHADGPLLAYTRPLGSPPAGAPEEVPGVAWSAPHAVVRNYADDEMTRDQSGLLQLVRRINAGEGVWLQEYPEHIKATEWASLLDLTTNDQLHYLRPLCDLYEAAPAEMMAALWESAETGKWVVPGGMDLLQFPLITAGYRRPREDLGWRFRAKVAAWALGDVRIATHPISHALGYRDSVMRRMEPAGVPWTPESAPQAIDAVKAVEKFVRHVDVAAKMALDTPQPITLTTTGGDITFENCRVSGGLRGLRVALPTGGALFYREAKLREDSGAIMLHGRPLAQRRIPMDLFYQFAMDVYHEAQWQSLFGIGAQPLPVTAAYEEWCAQNGLKRP